MVVGKVDNPDVRIAGASINREMHKKYLDRISLV